jgi:hypothetical protein
MQDRKEKYPTVFAIGIHVRLAGGGPVDEAIKKVFCK